MLTLLISPPLIPLPSPLVPPILTSLTLRSPSCSITSSTRCFFSASEMCSGRRRRAAKRRASRTVRVAGRMSCWGTKPIRGGREVDEEGEVEVPGGRRTEPVIIPDLCFSERISTSVVFPAPEKIAMNNEDEQECKRSWKEARTTWSKNSHHLPRLDFSAHPVQNDLVTKTLILSSPEPTVPATPRDHISQIPPYHRHTTMFTSHAHPLPTSPPHSSLIPQPDQQPQQNQSNQSPNDRQPRYDSRTKLSATSTRRTTRRRSPTGRIDHPLSDAFSKNTIAQR